MGEKIAILEKDAVIREFYERLLSDMGYKTWYSANGREIVHALCRDKKGFNLLIVEPLLTYEDGWSLLHEIRESAGLKEIPIMVVTADDLTKKELQPFQPLMNAVIRKNEFNVEVFRNTVQSLLANDQTAEGMNVRNEDRLIRDFCITGRHLREKYAT